MESNCEMSIEDHSDISFASESLENLLDKANDQILRHREWLANLPRNHDTASTTIRPPLNLVTNMPYLLPRQTAPPGCSDISALAFGAGASSASNAFSQSLSSASVAILSLSSVLAGAQASASAAFSLATNSVLKAQISMDSVLSSAEKSASEMVASAVEMVASANAAASEAKAKATNEIQKADASISAATQAAEASITASQTAAMNTTKFALSVTFAIFGSSFLSIILFYLIMRERQHRKEQRQARLKEKIHLRNTRESPFLESDIPPARLDDRRSVQLNNEFPGANISAEVIGLGNALPQETDARLNGSRVLPIIRLNSNELTPAQSLESDTGVEIPNSLKRRYTEGFKPSSTERINREEKYKTYDPGSTKSSRKPMLQYDPDRPGDPPTWIHNAGEEIAVGSSPTAPTEESSGTSSTGKDIMKEIDNMIGAAI